MMSAMPRPAAVDCQTQASPYHTAREAHAACMVCGDRDGNPHALRLKFVPQADGSVSASYQPDPHHQGYPDMLHGGIISTLLDAAMTHCLFARGVRALTAELTVRFVAPAATRGCVELRARVLERRRRTYRLEARMMRGPRLLARATATFIDPGPLHGRTAPGVPA